MSVSVQLHWHWPFEKLTIPRKTPYSCLPCQREVDWRQGTNCCFVAFCLRYAHSFYIVNFSAVKTEGLLYTTDPSKTALSLEKGEVRSALNLPRQRWTSVARSSRANYGGDCSCLEVVSLIPLVLFLFHIDRCTHSNSEPEKCYLAKRTIGSLLS